MSEFIDKTLGNIGQFLETVEAKIADSLAAGKTLPATKLARDVGPSFGFEWPQAYHIINIYIDQRPQLEIGKGPKGGIRLRTIKVDAVDAKPEDSLK
jgi:hypothetical protein